MRIDLRYGTGQQSLLLPAEAEVEYVEPRAMSAFDDTAGALGRALKNPVGSKPLSAMLDARQRVLVVVSDPTRSGTATMLPLFVETLVRMGLDKTQLSVLIARGTHRSLTREERRFLRSGPMRGVTVEEHDCDDPGKLSALLLTTHGTPVRVNRALRQADAILLLSPVSFHYFAGFGGGRKLVLPGCADRTSILANHRLSLVPEKPAKLHPACNSGKLEGNPVHEDMLEALAALDHVFAVNYFCDTLGRPAFVNAGDPVSSHVEACEAYAAAHQSPVDSAARVIVLSAGGAPYDMNMLQAHKALRHGCTLARDGASVLYYASCEEGIGSKSLAAALESDHEKFLKRAHSDYDLNNQTAVSLLGLTRRYRVGMVTELDASVLESAGIMPLDNAEAFLADALEQAGTRKVRVMRFGAQTLPISSGSTDIESFDRR